MNNINPKKIELIEFELIKNKQFDYFDFFQKAMIGFDKTAGYKPNSIKLSHNIMEYFISKGLPIERYDFGKGKGKYRIYNNNITGDYPDFKSIINKGWEYYVYDFKKKIALNDLFRTIDIYLFNIFNINKNADNGMSGTNNIYILKETYYKNYYFYKDYILQNLKTYLDSKFSNTNINPIMFKTSLNKNFTKSYNYNNWKKGKIYDIMDPASAYNYYYYNILDFVIITDKKYRVPFNKVYIDLELLEDKTKNFVNTVNINSLIMTSVGAILNYYNRT